MTTQNSDLIRIDELEIILLNQSMQVYNNTQRTVIKIIVLEIVIGMQKKEWNFISLISPCLSIC